MSEPTYAKVFETIRSSLVPKSQFEEAQKEISILRSQLETAKNSERKLKSEYDDQKLTIDILRAEKETLENEKRTLESKFKEVYLILTQKTREYDSLQTAQTDCNPSNVVSGTVRNQSIKQEPPPVGIVNVPASSTSRLYEPGMKTRSKRGITAGDDEKRTSAKRQKTSTPAKASKQSTEIQQIFSCHWCLSEWGCEIDRDFYSNSSRLGVPDPKTRIWTFSTFKEYKDHCFIAHDGYSQEQIDNGCYETDKFCQENSCLESFTDGVTPTHHWPHGDINCEVCGLSFKFKRHHDTHIKLEHANINVMSKEEIFELHRFSQANF